MIISLDFDGTITYQNYPNIGELLPFAKDVISYIHSRGHEIIINTCRNDIALREAVGYLKFHEIPFDYVNKNSPRSIKRYGGDTKKISADVNIDDKNLFIQYNWSVQGKDFCQNNFWLDVDKMMFQLEKPLVICIVGESGAGKTMAAEYFEYEYGVNLIQSYTDRAKRFNGEGGHTFVKPTRMDAILSDRDNILAETEFGGYRYACLRSDITHSNVYILDEHGLKMLKNKWEDELDIYSIRIHRQKDKRIASVGEERVARDKGKFSLPDSYYDFVINNVVDEKEYVYEKVDEFVKTFRFKQRFEEYEIIMEEEIMDDEL